MLDPGINYKLDWRVEFSRLDPFLKGRGGVVRVDNAYEDAAPAKFNHLIKEGYGQPGNGIWTSLRIDSDWFTTRRLDGILDEIERLLGEQGFSAPPRLEKPYALSLVSGNDVEGNLDASLSNVTVIVDGAHTAHAERARVEAVCDCLRRYVAAGGHFMIVVNDASLRDQSPFWQRLWNVGLAEAGGMNLLLLIYTGPESDRALHPDAPSPNLSLALPLSIESDETRQNDVYDDIISIFVDDGYDYDEISVAADAIISGHGHSVNQVHMGLSKLIMRLNSKGEEGK